MIDMRARTKFYRNRVLRKARTGSIRSLGHAGAAIRLAARRSIRTRLGPSAPGAPVHSRRGQMRRAILYAVERRRQRVLIGPTYEIVGPSAAAHEFGGRYRGDDYPARPFMGPALEKIRPRLPKFWAASIR